MVQFQTMIGTRPYSIGRVNVGSQSSTRGNFSPTAVLEMSLMQLFHRYFSNEAIRSKRLGGLLL
jgi:hypothetical protein